LLAAMIETQVLAAAARVRSHNIFNKLNHASGAQAKLFGLRARSAKFFAGRFLFCRIPARRVALVPMRPAVNHF